MAKFGIIGREGRMGQALLKAVAEAGHEFSIGVERGEDPEPAAVQSDVLVDFSAPDALSSNLAAARLAEIPIVICTTGLTREHHLMIDDAAQHLPVLQTGNTSFGITLLSHLVEQAASRLGPDWDIEIVEMHHRHKVDAPSGTATLLGEAAAVGRGIELETNSESGRRGRTGKRKRGLIGFAALRGGTVTGDHSVIFAGGEERLTLSHSAENRMIFAHGAVKAGEWLIAKEPGRYKMSQVLGL